MRSALLFAFVLQQVLGYKCQGLPELDLSRHHCDPQTYYQVKGYAYFCKWDNMYDPSSNQNNFGGWIKIGPCDDVTTTTTTTQPVTTTTKPTTTTTQPTTTTTKPITTTTHPTTTTTKPTTTTTHPTTTTTKPTTTTTQPTTTTTQPTTTTTQPTTTTKPTTTTTMPTTTTTKPDGDDLEILDDSAMCGCWCFTEPYWHEVEDQECGCDCRGVYFDEYPWYVGP